MEASGWIWCSIGASSGNYGRNGRRIYSKNKQRNFSSGNSCSNDTGDAELYSDKKVCGKKKKLDTPVPEQKYGAAEKEAAVYSEDQKESGTLSGSNADDSRKELEKIKKNIPTKAEDFLDGFGETVVLSAGASKGPATLVSREPGELATIYLERDITVIGKLETAADAVINIPTVSRIHAKIRKREGAYYLADLNSRNGTSVNGQLLKTGEDYLLEDEDEVDFAQARYIFLK